MTRSRARAPGRPAARQSWDFSALFVVLLAASGPRSASADTLRLKNGNTLEGTITSRDDRHVTIELPDLGALVVDRAEIAAIEQPPPAEAPPQPGSAPAAVSGETLDWFGRPERDVRLAYPKGWNVLDRMDRHPYTVTASPDPLPPTSGAPTVLELRKYYHASRTAGVKPDARDRLLESYLDKLREQGARIGDRWAVTVQGVPGIAVEARRVGAKSVSRLLLVLAAKDDVLAVVYGQAPSAAFDAQRPLFLAAAERVAPFSADPANPDNTRLDAESRTLTEQALMAIKNGSAADAVGKMQTALRANPGDMVGRVAYGSLLLDLGLQEREPQRGASLARAEAELRQAAEWMEAERDPAKAPALAQVYFLMGELEARGRSDPANAKTLYERALEVLPTHPGAKKALGR